MPKIRRSYSIWEDKILPKCSTCGKVLSKNIDNGCMCNFVERELYKKMEGGV